MQIPRLFGSHTFEVRVACFFWLADAVLSTAVFLKTCSTSWTLFTHSQSELRTSECVCASYRFRPSGMPQLWMNLYVCVFLAIYFRRRKTGAGKNSPRNAPKAIKKCTKTYPSDEYSHQGSSTVFSFFRARVCDVVPIVPDRCFSTFAGGCCVLLVVFRNAVKRGGCIELFNRCF